MQIELLFVVTNTLTVDRFGSLIGIIHIAVWTAKQLKEGCLSCIVMSSLLWPVVQDSFLLTVLAWACMVWTGRKPALVGTKVVLTQMVLAVHDCTYTGNSIIILCCPSVYIVCVCVY